MRQKSWTVIYIMIGFGIVISILGIICAIKRKRAQVAADAQKIIIKEKVLPVLKQLKREQYSEIVNIQNMMSDLDKQGTTYSLREKYLATKAHEKKVKEDLAKTKLAVLEQHQISEKDYDSYCQIILKDDKEIQKMITSYDKRIKNAFEGKHVDISTTIPEVLTPSKLLQIRKEICKEICRKQQCAFKQMKAESGKVNMEAKQTLMQLEMVNIDQIENAIYTKHFLIIYEDTANQIFKYATEQFTEESEKFKSELDQIERDYIDCKKALEDNPYEEGLIERFFKVQEEETFQGGMIP